MYLSLCVTALQRILSRKYTNSIKISACHHRPQIIILLFLLDILTRIQKALVHRCKCYLTYFFLLQKAARRNDKDYREFFLLCIKNNYSMKDCILKCQDWKTAHLHHFFPTNIVWMNSGSQEEITVLSMYQPFHHLPQLQQSGNKHLVKTGFQPVQRALGKLLQKPSPKCVQLPVTQTNGAEKGQPTCLLCRPHTRIFIWQRAADTYHALQRDRRGAERR